MKRIPLIGTVFLLSCITGMASEPLRISSATVDASQLVFEVKTPSTISVLPGTDFRIEEQFEIPEKRPSFLILETRSNVGGRINLFLKPDPLPLELQKALSSQEQPVDNPAFQVVIDTKPGEWQRHSIDVSADFFETVSPSTEPYDLSGCIIKSVRLEAADPFRPELMISVRGIKIVTLTGDAMKVDLAGRSGDLKLRLEKLEVESKLREYWQPTVLKLADQSQEFDHSTEDWRRFALTLERIHFQSHYWSLGNLPDKSYAVGIASSLRRISGNHPKFLFRGNVDEEVQIQTAKNEYESFQLVILPLMSGLQDVTIQVSDLVSTDGNVTIAAGNLELFHQIEQFVKPSRGTAYDWAGWLPDAIQPVEGSFDVHTLEAEPIWASIYVPGDKEAGTYRGEIRIVPSGEAPTTVPITVKVHPFGIPRVGNFRTQGHFSLEDLQAWYKKEYSAEVRRAFYRLMVQYRQSPTSQYSPILSPVADDIPWIMRNGGNVILIGGFSGQDPNSEIIDPAYEWLVENDYIDQAIIYVGDETDDFERMKAKARTIRRRWPKLRIMIGGSKPREELIGYFDVWDPITHGGEIYNFDPGSTKAAVERGEEMFWYTCVGPRAPYANVYNDHPLTATRALWWQAWKYGITGFEYWWFNYWRPNLSLSEGSSPWPSSRKRSWNSRSFKWSNGDGVLVYPGPDGEALPSIRLSVMRDAIEDWEVLFMLERAVELGRKSSLPASKKYLELAERLLSVPEEITTSLTEWSAQPEVYFKAREEAYELLSSLRSVLGGEAVDRYTESWVEERQSWLQKKFEERVAASR